MLEFLVELKRPNVGRRDSDDFVPGMYPDANVTPYMHAMLHHMPDHLAYAAKTGIPLRRFDTEPVEKKNHIQVAQFFAKTTKNGGKSRTDAIYQIMQIENRLMYKSDTPKKRTVHRFRI
jgi:hypothetical protein